MKIAMETRMKVLSNSLLLVALLLLQSGCAFTPQTADVQVEVQVVESNEGGGAPINLRVVDERTNQIIGRRGTGAMKGAEITSTKPLDVTFHEAIADGLTKKGFVIVDDTTNAHSLRVDIRSFEYDVSMGFWTGGVHTNAALKATAKRGSEDYDNIYRFEGEKRIVFVPGADKNTQMINEMANGVLQEMFADNALMGFLAQ
jgi:uncharacterized lipoprotein YajG